MYPDPEPTADERRADLAAFKQAAKDRDAFPRYTSAWQTAIDIEEVDVARVRRWLEADKADDPLVPMTWPGALHEDTKSHQTEGPPAASRTDRLPGG
jgi:hypothetical protein